MPDAQERLLEQFQKKSLDRPAAANYDDGAYHAFKAVDRKQRRLLLRPVGGSSEWLTYQYLLRIVLDPGATKLALIFSFMAITITGRNLEELAVAVAEEHCDFIQQFDGKVWKKPTDSAAIVESIEFITNKPPMSATEKDA
jgi:hypothetical protein